MKVLHAPRRAVLLAILALVSLVPVSAPAQGLDFIRANYTKYEYTIPMRDGVKLFTAVYAPKDQSKRYPILFDRTPYSVGPYGVDAYKSDLGPSPQFAQEGYIFAYQDVRGKWMSEGEFVNMRPHLDRKSKPTDMDESTDTYDTIDWLVKNIPGNNGRVGMWGISYPGFYTAAGMIDAHPALKAASPQAPVTDWFTGDDWHHNGALQLPHAFNFLAAFERPHPAPTSRMDFHEIPFDTADGYDFFLNLGPLANVNTRFYKGQVPFWNDILAHGTFDAFWQARNIRAHLKDIKPAVMTVGGWFDAENLFGALETYKHVERTSPGATNILVMGPWRHGGWARGEGASLGPIAFHSKTAEFFQEHIQFPFFQHYLKGVDTPALPEAYVFETGSNQWRQYDHWPPAPAQARSLYLQPKGGLAWAPPSGDVETPFDEYESDPAHPVPYLDQVETRMDGEYMIKDQRVAARRPDVLTYMTEPLSEDVTLVGPVKVRMVVSTSGTDSDFIVKLIDVFPGDFPPDQDEAPARPGARGAGPRPTARFAGYQMLVRGDVMRGKFRKSLEKPEPFEPNQPTPLAFDMSDVAHSFRKGHRIMIQVQSTWFPLIDRNPQKFVDIYSAKESDFQKASERVYRTQAQPSHLEVLALPAPAQGG